MFELLLPLVASSSLGWACFRAVRRDRPVALGAAVMGVVLGGAWAAAGTSAWAEGGPEMNVLALTGSYGLGAAVAFLFSGGRGAKYAALVGAGVTAVLAGYFYFHGMQELEAVLRNVVDPRDAEVIRAGSRVELMRLVQLGGALVVTTSLLLLKRPSTPTGLTGATLSSRLHSSSL